MKPRTSRKLWGEKMNELRGRGLAAGAPHWRYMAKVLNRLKKAGLTWQKGKAGGFDYVAMPAALYNEAAKLAAEKLPPALAEIDPGVYLRQVARSLDLPGVPAEPEPAPETDRSAALLKRACAKREHARERLANAQRAVARWEARVKAWQAKVKRADALVEKHGGERIP